MRTKLLLLVTLSFLSLKGGAQIHFPDNNFKNELLAHGVTVIGTNISVIDTNGDGEISKKEAKMYNGFIEVNQSGIYDLTGIEWFKSIKGLSCNGNQLTSIDISNNINLEYLNCGHNQLTSLNVSYNTNLATLGCGYNKITRLNVSNNTKLKQLYCSDNEITKLNIGTIPVEYLWCEGNKLRKLDLSGNKSLEYIACYSNELTEILFSNKPFSLEEIHCGGNNLTSLDFSKAPALRELSCSSNNLQFLDLANTNNNNLFTLNAKSNPDLTCINIDAGFAPPNSWQKDITANYSDRCVKNYGDSLLSEISRFKTENKHNSNKRVVIYPNPSNDEIKIQAEEKINKLSLYTLEGKRILEYENKNKLNISKVEKGMYWLLINTDVGVVKERIIKK